MEERRACPQCNRRMSSLQYDRHKICSTCRGFNCTSERKCEECSNWSIEEFDKFAKHQRTLAAKGKAKAKNSSRSSGSGPSHSGSSKGDGSNVGISESRVK